MMDDFCTPQEAAELLGVSRQSVYSLAHRYQWESRKLGPARLFRRSDVLTTPRDEGARRSESQRKRRQAEPNISTHITPPPVPPAASKPIKPLAAKPKRKPGKAPGRGRG